MPGYFYQELSAKSYALAGGNYILPLDKRRHWSLNVNASTAWVDYLDGLEQPGHWNSGVGGGILYRSNALKIMVGYGYGIAAIRSDGRGANTIGMLMQIDLERVKTDLIPCSGRSQPLPRFQADFQRLRRVTRFGLAMPRGGRHILRQTKAEFYG